MISLNQKMLLDILKREVVPATGCTEPVAVAYSAADARERLEGMIESMEIWVNPGLFKNGMRVGIPGVEERGLDMAAALGYAGGKCDRGFQVIDELSEEEIRLARTLIAQGRIKVHIKKGVERLYIETVLTTDRGKIRVIALDRHLNIVSVEEGSEFKPFEFEDDGSGKTFKAIREYDIYDFVDFAESLPVEELLFLGDGVRMNKKMAEEGLRLEGGIGRKFQKMISEGLICDSMISRAQILCAAASEARMAGIKKPVMSSAGSGNHGITVFLTNTAVAEMKGISEEKLLRALALSNLITVYIKSYTGTLSAMCGCGIAAGIGASAGVVYLLGGTTEQMLGAVRNMAGSISGIICDGGKEGCAYKLALASGWAVEAALLSMSGAVVDSKDGILAPDFKQLVKNLGYVCNPGMIQTDEAILQVMQGQNK